MSVIKGKQVIMYFQFNGQFLPLACATSCSLTTNAIIGETSSLNSGKWQTFRGLKLNWTISCDGLCSEDMNLTVPQLRQIQFNLQAVLINFTATDDNGLIENFSGNCIITTVNTPASVTGMYEYSMEAQGIGELIIGDAPIDPNLCCDTIWYYYDGAGGEYTTGSIPDFIGVTIDGRIYRDGIEYRPSGVNQDGSDVPVGKQFSFDPVTGAIGFDTSLPPLEAGEQIDIPYKTCTPPVAECVPVQIEQIQLPDAVIGQSYNQTIALTGTQPFTLQPGATKPTWMNISISGTNILLTGIPTTVQFGAQILFTVTNCTGGSDSFTDAIDTVNSGAIGVCIDAHDEVIGSEIFVGVNSTDIVSTDVICHVIIHTNYDDYNFDRTLRSGTTASAHGKLQYSGLHVDETMIGSDIFMFNPSSQGGRNFQYTGFCP